MEGLALWVSYIGFVTWHTYMTSIVLLVYCSSGTAFFFFCIEKAMSEYDTAINIFPEDRMGNEELKSVLTVCPKCKGKGFLAEKVEEKRRNGMKSSSDSMMPMALPKIRTPQRNRSAKPQVGLKKTAVNDVLPTLPSKSQYTVVNGVFGRARTTDRLPPLRRRDSSAASTGSSINGEIIPQVEIVDMPEFIKRAKARMKSSDLGEVSLGVVDVVHICRADEDAAYELMPDVNRHLVDMLRSTRVIVLRKACQAITNLFKTLTYITRPEFDEMLMLLLKRTADTKTRVREDATEALNVLVMTSPPTYVIRALCRSGPDSKNPALRVMSTKIITRCVDQVGRDQLLTHPSLREMRKRVIESGCGLLLDPQTEVRTLAKRLMSSLKDVDGFEEALETDAPRGLLKEVDRTLMWLRHIDRPPISHRVDET